MNIAHGTARELNAMRLCDTVITHSTAEAAYLAKTARGAAVHVVPWTPLVKPRPMPFAARRDVVAIGSWSHEPNVDAVRWLVSGIMPRVWQQAPINLLVVGSDWPSHVPWIADPRVRLVGPVASMETLLATPRLSVAALRFGGDEVEEVPLRHEADERARPRNVAEIGDRDAGRAEARAEFVRFGVRDFEKALQEAEFVENV